MRERQSSSAEHAAANADSPLRAPDPQGATHTLQRGFGNRIVGQALREAGGSPLPPRVRREAESALGENLAGVRVHAGSHEAVLLRSLAFARGDHIHFAPGALGRDIVRGHPVLRHELGHVGQQRRGEVPVTGFIAGIPVNTDASLERAANGPVPAGAARGPASAVAQRYTDASGHAVDASSQSREELAAVLQSWADRALVLAGADAAEVVNAFAVKCREAGMGRFNVHLDVFRKIQSVSLDRLDDLTQEFLVAETQAHAAPESKAPKGLGGMLTAIWERATGALDIVDSAASLNALVKSTEFSEGVQAAEAVLGPIGIALAAIGLAGNVKDTVQAALRYNAAKAALIQVGARDELGPALEFARDENAWSAGIHLVRALIDAAMIAFGALALATAGWASPALAVAGLLGLVMGIASWIWRRIRKREREDVTRKLWKYRADPAVSAMLATAAWGGFTEDDLSDKAGNEAKFLRVVSDGLKIA